MLRLNFDKLRTILCLGAHSDDLEIGAGGTILSCSNLGGCSNMTPSPKADLWGVWSEPSGARNFAVVVGEK